MLKKRDFNQSNNIFAAIGRPLFLLIILFISSVGAFVLFLQRLSLLFLSFTIPKLNFPKIKLKRPKTPSFPKIPLHINPQHFVFPVAIICLGLFVYLEFLYNLPDPNTLANFPSKLTTQILDRNGKLLYKIYKDENRTLIILKELPQHVINAFLAAEDKDFYFHKGFSISGLFRALYKNVIDDKQEGGSTITQQLIKNTILTPEKTVTRKVKELILAIQTETIFTKDEILEMYLNQVGFGGPAYGIQEASRQYFDVDAKDLSISQAAYLAGLTRAPSKYSPYGDHPEQAVYRQQLVLSQMQKAGFITPDQANEALSNKLVFKSAKIEIKAPHFVMLVKDILVSQLGESKVNQGGLIVYTTLDTELQDKVQSIVTEEVKKLKSYKVSNGAALITNPKTGDILAMVGSKDYFNLNENGQVNLTTSLRQPGSSIKPLNYALSFENGLSPASIIDDKPISFNLAGQSPWTPKNYDGRFHGTVTLRQALGSSYNIPSVLLLAQNGVTNFANFSKKLGISSWEDTSRFGLSMALGSLEVKMTDLATAYSTFANQGINTPLRTILKIEKLNEKNSIISSCPSVKPNLRANATANAEDSSCISSRVISPTTAYFISDILSDNAARTPAFGQNSILNITDAKIAVKTGTSNDLRDNWTIGYSNDFLVSTWVGNNDNSPMSSIASGITGASPIWAKIFGTILKDSPQPKSLNTPDNIIRVPVCILTGSLTCTGCPTRYDYFIKGQEPKKACDPEDIKRRLNATPTVTKENKPQIL